MNRITSVTVPIRPTWIMWAVLVTVVAAGPVVCGGEGPRREPPDPLSEKKTIVLVQFREGYKWQEGKVMWETEKRIGIQTNGSTIPYRKESLKEIRRHTVSSTKYYLEKAEEADNTYSAKAYREAISLVKKALDVDPDHQPAQEKLKEYKDELERLTRIKKQKAEAKLANRRLQALNNMQNKLQSLSKKVKKISEEVDGRRDQMLAELQNRMRRMGNNVAQLHRYYRKLEEDIDDLYRYRYRRGGSYFYYYRRDDNDNNHNDYNKNKDRNRQDDFPDRDRDDRSRDNSPRR